MKQLILGTAGHIDHGKTTLVRALTGIDTDRLPEEKRRGITIDLGFADMMLGDDLHVGIVDVPGHESFIRNMLAGATGIDLGLLVVAADEGVMPQTREHLSILELAGVRDLVVALTKSDIADQEWRDLVADDVAGLLASTAFANGPVIEVSATTGKGLDTLKATLADRAGHVRSRAADDLFRLPIDRVFSVRGTGTVTTGTLWSGSIVRDDSVTALPGERKARIRAVQTHGHERDRAVAGERTALALAGVDRDELTRGDVLVDHPGWRAGSIVTARLRLLSDAPAVRRGQRVRFHLGTAEVPARVVPYGGTNIVAGDTAHVQLRLEKPAVARAGDRFVIRSWSPIATIGGGSITEPAARRRKRIAEASMRRLDTIIDGNPEDSIEAAAALAGWTGLAAHEASVRTPHPPDTVAAALTSAAKVTEIAGTIYHDGVVSSASQRIAHALGEFHAANPLAPGLSRERLRQTVPAGNVALADHVVARLLETGTIMTDGNMARLADFTPELSPPQQQACQQLLAEYATAGMASPTTADLPERLASRPDLDDLLHHLARAGSLIELAPDRYLDAAAAGMAARQVRETLGGRSGLSPGDFRDLFGISRKFLLPLLGWLDRTGVTVRDGEVRQVTPLETPLQDGTP